MMVLWSSYRTYIIVLWAVGYLILIQLLSEKSRRQWLPVAWLLAAGICLVSYVTYLPEAIDRRHNMQGLTFNQHYSRIGLGGSRNTGLARYIDSLTLDMGRRGWYSLPKPALGPGEEQVLTPVRVATRPPVLTLTMTPDYVNVSSHEPGYVVDLTHETYVVLKSDRHTYVMSARRPPLTNLRPWSHPPGFVADVPTALLQPGRYQVGLLRTFADRSDVAFTDQRVVVE